VFIVVFLCIIYQQNLRGSAYYTVWQDMRKKKYISWPQIKNLFPQIKTWFSSNLWPHNICPLDLIYFNCGNIKLWERILNLWAQYLDFVFLHMSSSVAL